MLKQAKQHLQCNLNKKVESYQKRLSLFSNKILLQSIPNRPVLDLFTSNTQGILFYPEIELILWEFFSHGVTGISRQNLKLRKKHPERTTHIIHRNPTHYLPRSFSKLTKIAPNPKVWIIKFVLVKRKTFCLRIQ